jgi:cytochrome c oxidase cbb3-type subunit 3
MKRWWAALGSAALLVACERAPPQAPNAETLEIGRQVYNFRCYFCHGYSGDAKTLAATYLTPAPRDFTAAAALTPETILGAVRDGRSGTAMQPFREVLSEAEMLAVSAFVAEEFVRRRARNTAYHTEQNGWPEHQRFAHAFPFVRGTLSADADAESLNDEQRRGRQLFVSACVSCHDRPNAAESGLVWSARPLSYPRFGFTPGQVNAPAVDALSGASVYARHDIAPRLAGLSPKQRRGERLFQANCAFCHGADGTGKNWIGQFMEPKARDLNAMPTSQQSAQHLSDVIRNGLPGTSMPAWRHVLQPAEINAIGAYVQRAFMGAHGDRAATPR